MVHRLVNLGLLTKLLAGSTEIESLQIWARPIIRQIWAPGPGLEGQDVNAGVAAAGVVCAVHSALLNFAYEWNWQDCGPGIGHWSC